MSQETNLNVAPYFDDFDAENDYYKVLFKPGYPVQARELTNLQSILQNQIEKFGQHFFKEGAKVIPGNTSYSTSYYAVQIDNAFLGLQVSDYIDQVVDIKITGQTSGVSAVVNKVINAAESERGSTTLYVSYLSSNTNNNTTQQFADGEELTADVTIASANTVINVGEPFAITIPTGATSTASAFFISEGVYFAKGEFLNVNTETLILDQYSNKPNYRIGLFINEELINADIDPTLNDNSQGFNNYSAPGADRLKITCSLHKKELDDFNDNSFVELATVTNGVLRSKKRTTDYSILADELARRTYAESGDYYVKPFNLGVKESLNNGLGNNGVFNSDQLTYGGSTPSDDMALYQVSPGKAFVKGYEVETIAPTFLDVPKPRTTKTLTNQQINYNTGATLKLNRVYSSPTIGIGNTFILSLRDSRVGSSGTIAAGKEIGVARVYDFKLESGSYSSGLPNTNEWDISLYDVQTISEITLNEPITLSVPTFIKGKYSGATAYLKDAVSASTALTVYEQTGDFVTTEPFVINGVDNPRIAIAVTSYGMGDVKSVFNNYVGTSVTFSADVIQSDLISIGIATITDGSGGGSISTVRSTNPLFPGEIRSGNLVKYTNTSGGTDDPSYAKVVSVGSSEITIEAVTTVAAVNDGSLPGANLTANDFTVLTTELSDSSDNTLYTKLPRNNISNVDLTNASLTIRKSYTVNIADNQLSSTVSAGTNETFLPFDAERYSLLRSDGSTEVLTSDKISLTGGSTSLQIYNLGSDDTGATLTATLTKTNPTAKTKIRNRVNTVLIDKSSLEGSGIGATTRNDGLTYGTYPYGTRVQDDDICLNSPDIIEVMGIYESSNTSDPSAPTVVLSSITGPTGRTSDLVIGEKFKGATSGACGCVAERVTDSQISYIPKNGINFVEGEVVSFGESNIQATVTTLDSPSYNVSFNYTFGSGQNESFYDFGVIHRKTDIKAPLRKLKVYFSNGYYESSDDGDITTVESYNSFDYTTEIQRVNGIRDTDIIDIRPRVSNYTVAEDTRSPLEFYGREFNASGNSAANILASNEGIVTDFSFYLPRIDRVFLTKNGKFQVKYGTPSERPEKPIAVDDALEVASVYLPAYLYNVENASKSFLEHKRYRMVDIKQLENRIRTLEYYTTLSLLETNTASLFIPDSQGLNRFKSGFFVDNFSSFLAQENAVLFKNSIDLNHKELRPSHHTDAIDLIQGPVEGVGTQDLATAQPQGVNIRKTGDVITLDYSEEVWLEQPFGTRTESVTPFMIGFWIGSIELTPASDNWVDTVRLEANITQTEGNFAETLERATTTLNVDPQTGFAPTIWGAWNSNWVGQEVVESTVERVETTNDGGRWTSGGGGRQDLIATNTTTVIQDLIEETIETGVETRTGNRTIVTEQWDNISQGERLVSRNLITFMRSRNIQFVGSKFKPNTQVYAFFDGVNVTEFCLPKLLEISMISGTFQVGETVSGGTRSTGNTPFQSESITPNISFRVASSNHKEGTYNDPSKVYTISPYDGQTIPSSYSSTSTILNVDTFSLANQVEGNYYGWVKSDMILVGETSGAQATISNVRLISDISARVAGSFFIPDPIAPTNPKFNTGDNVFILTNSNINNNTDVTTIGIEGFSSSGIVETVQEDIVSVRNAIIETQEVTEQQDVTRTVGTQVLNSETVSTETSTTTLETRWPNPDPLAQSFVIDDSEAGIFVTKCDVFFEKVDNSDIPVTFQLRTMKNGYPTQKVLPFSEVIIPPSDITTSTDGSVAHTVTFKSPVYLEGGVEYCMVLNSVSGKYRVFISQVGEEDLITQTFISNQPYLGSLFKSQNASTWEPSQWEDLKFTLYRADFVGAGNVEFYNPELSRGNGEIPTLMPNALELTSRTLRVGIGSTLQDADLVLGQTVSQLGSNATGKYAGNAGIATGTLNITTIGVGYTPSSGTLQYNGVPLTNITGTGFNALADITISNGVAVAATISSFNAASGGTGYQVGDVLGIGTIGAQNLGTGARLSLVSIANTNEIILDNVQGDFVTGAGNTIQFVNNAGLTTDLNAASGGNVLPTSLNVTSEGMNILVNHKNHGMYFSRNYVTLSKIQSDINPVLLTASYDSTSTAPLSVDSVSDFGTFENVGIGTTNVGYLLIDDEIISYTATDTNSIEGTITRNVDSTTGKNYPAGTKVYKYELGGVSLRRINKTHNLENVTASDPYTFDSYKVKLDMGSSGVGRSTAESFPILYMGETKSAGGYNIRATQNMPFELVTPMVQNLTVQGTTLSGELRTVTAASISGSETAWLDQGFESVALNKTNYLTTPRTVASTINATNYLSTLPGNKSLNLKVNLDTIDSKVSPVIDTTRISAILTSNRVNDVVTNFATDSRVNNIYEDPTAFQYLSKAIRLENPATGLKIIVDAYTNLYSTVRAFYATGDSENFEPIYVPFPGYNNLNDIGEIIDPANNDGLSDKYISPSSTAGFLSNEVRFNQHEFTIDELSSFRAYRIKIVMTSTNQAYVPRIRDLRVIALA